MKCKKLIYSGHAIKQMFKREINEVEQAIKYGEIIKEYPNDKPYPSFLILHKLNNRFIHLVASIDSNSDCYIITVYIPNPDIWNTDFKTKK